MSFSPISTIKKVWKELEEEEKTKSEQESHNQEQHQTKYVKFSPSTDKPPATHHLKDSMNTRSSHYLSSDKVRKGLNTKIKGSPRILQPSTEQKKNTSWVSSTFARLGKMVFPGEEQSKSELDEMKSYVNGMIRKRSRSTPSSILSQRSLKKRALNEAFKNSHHAPINSQIKRLQHTDFDLSDSSMNDSIGSVINRPRNKPSSLRDPDAFISSTPLLDKSTNTTKFDLPSSPFEPVQESITAIATGAKFQRENEDLKKRVETLEQMLHKTEQKVSDLELQLNESSILRNESFERIDDALHESELLVLSPAKVNLSVYK